MIPHYLLAYLITACVFLVLDVVWLSWIARQFYFDRLGEILRDQPNFFAAGAFYAIYIAGIVIFVITPAIRLDSAQHALVYGALFGFIAYGTYDMTNYATLKNWPFVVAAVDMAWGACLTGLSAFAGYLGTRYLLNG